MSKDFDADRTSPAPPGIPCLFLLPGMGGYDPDLIDFMRRRELVGFIAAIRRGDVIGKLAFVTARQLSKPR